MSSLKYWLWLSSIKGLGNVSAVRLLLHFGDPEAVYHAGMHEYREVEGLGRVDISRLMDKNTDNASKILESCASIGCSVITLYDDAYPDRLRNIYGPPIALYVLGSLPVIDEEPVVAIVGTRNCTPYGISVAENTGYRLAISGLIVASGLARGVDTAAIRGALRGGGLVLGVIGSGPDIVYPPENRDLFDAVARAGAVISEYPPGTPAVPTNFPARNRIISGLSLGVAVIEAPKKSGALITATRSLEQGRDVFALPGNVDARSCEGSNALLREGAIPFLSGDDIISEYAELFPDKIVLGAVARQDAESRANRHVGNFERNNGAQSQDTYKNEIDNKSKVDYIDLSKILGSLDGDEHTVATAIGSTGAHVDDIVASSGLPAQRILTALTMLELKGLAERGLNGIWMLRED